MKSCLVVDDSTVVRKVTMRILKELSFTCQEAGNGEEAFQICQEQMPELIMLDWNMPVMNGLDFLHALRAFKGGTYPKVIFCTTENDMTHISQAIQAGANEYIMKPFDKEIVQDKLQQIGLLS